MCLYRVGLSTLAIAMCAAALGCAGKQMSWSMMRTKNYSYSVNFGKFAM